MNWNEVIGSSALVPLFQSSGLALAVPTSTRAAWECFSERAGNLNLGVEGMMLSGAFSGFIGTYYTHSVAVGVLCGIGAGVLLGILMGGLSVWLKTEQVINGIALVLFAQGLTAFVYRKPFSTNSTPTISTPGNLHVPLLADIPVIGPVLFKQNSLFYIAVAAMLGRDLRAATDAVRTGLRQRPAKIRPPPTRQRSRSIGSGGSRCSSAAPRPDGPWRRGPGRGTARDHPDQRDGRCRLDRGGARHLRPLEPRVRDRRRVPVRNHRRSPVLRI